MAASACVRYLETDLPDDRSSGGAVVGFVPSELVSVREVTIPKGGRRHQDRLVRFGLEESLADDLEHLHFALQAVDSGKATVFITRHEDMQEWLGWYRQRGMTMRGLLPDFFSLPCMDDGWVCRVETERVLVRTGVLTGFALPPDLFATFLAIAPQGGKVRTLHLAGGQLDAGLRDSAAASGWTISEAPVAGNDRDYPAGLISGPYAGRDRTALRNWWLAAGLLLFALLIEIGAGAYRYLELRNQTAKTEVEIERIFRETFPGITHIVDAEAQGIQALQSLRAARRDRDRGFLALMSPLAQALAAVPRSGLSKIAFTEGQLTIELDAENSKEIRRRLENAGLAIEGSGTEWILSWRPDA